MRESWDEYFMGIAWMVSRRATCDRLHVGCVIVDHRTIVATGYNGSVVGRDHCDDEGHDLVNGHCVRTVHAEQNAIAQAARRGVSLANGIAYITAFPCWTCAKLLANSGVHVVRYAKAYRTDERVWREFGDRIMCVDVEDPIALLEESKKEVEQTDRLWGAAEEALAHWKKIASDRAASLRRLTPHGGDDE